MSAFTSRGEPRVFARDAGTESSRFVAVRRSAAVSNMKRKNDEGFRLGIKLKIATSRTSGTSAGARGNGTRILIYWTNLGTMFL